MFNYTVQFRIMSLTWALEMHWTAKLEAGAFLGGQGKLIDCKKRTEKTYYKKRTEKMHQEPAVNLIILLYNFIADT
jgi:hypothetical protein